MTAKPTADSLREAASQAAKEADAAARRAETLWAEARKLERKEREDRNTRERRELSDRLYAEIGHGIAGLNEAQHRVAFDLAWSKSKSEGVYHVEATYGDLVDFYERMRAQA